MAIWAMISFIPLPPNLLHSAHCLDKFYYLVMDPILRYGLNSPTGGELIDQACTDGLKWTVASPPSFFNGALTSCRFLERVYWWRHREENKFKSSETWTSFWFCTTDCAVEHGRMLSSQIPANAGEIDSTVTAMTFKLFVYKWAHQKELDGQVPTEAARVAGSWFWWCSTPHLTIEGWG